MRFFTDPADERVEEADDPVHGSLDLGGVATERDRGQIDNEVAPNDEPGDVPRRVVHEALAGVAFPAAEAAEAVCDIEVSEDEWLDAPATRHDVRGQKPV
jgi:hypothetical protein